MLIRHERLDDLESLWLPNTSTPFRRAQVADSAGATPRIGYGAGMEAIETIMPTWASRRFTGQSVDDADLAALIPAAYQSGNSVVSARRPAVAVTHWNHSGDKRR